VLTEVLETCSDGIMPQTTRLKRMKLSIESHLALTARVLKGLHKSIDEQIELARDIEAECAIALLESGKAKLIDHDEMIRLAKKRLG
jgi:hypothetical protein